MYKYYTSGWERYLFIVTPAELESILSDMHGLIVNTHVPEGYIETPIQEFTENYRVLYEKLAAGIRLEWKEDWRLLRAFGAASSLEKHRYGYHSHFYEGKRYVYRGFDEPCAIIQQFPLFVPQGGREKLVTNTSVTQFPESTVGLELLYPKRIQFVRPGEEVTYIMYETTQSLDSYQDYTLLRDRIKKITKPFRVIVEGKEVRTRIRISPEALKDVDKFYFFKANNVTVIK